MEIFVGCSCSDYVDVKYKQVAYHLGEVLAKHGHSLIFGSSNYGLMGEVYRGFLDNDGKVTAVIPIKYRGFLQEVEAHTVIQTETASEQLKELVNGGDVTVILPGSFGTLAELMTSIHYKKLGEHQKKIFIVNAFGFFDDLLGFFDKIFQEQFDLCERDVLYKIVNTPEEIISYLDN